MEIDKEIGYGQDQKVKKILALIMTVAINVNLLTGKNKGAVV